MEIIKQPNCNFRTKDIILVATIVGTAIIASLCNKEEVYE